MPIDLIIFGSGLLTTLLLVMFLPMDILWVAILAISPGIITGLLVLPVAYYHNVRQLIIEIYKYLTQRNRYIWKGWCFFDEGSSK